MLTVSECSFRSSKTKYHSEKLIKCLVDITVRKSPMHKGERADHGLRYEEAASPSVSVY